MRISRFYQKLISSSNSFCNVLFSIDVVNGIKQNDISLTFQKSDVMSAGKQSDIILKFQKADTVKVEGSKTT